MGFWRGVGYFISILMIISGFLGALYTYGLSLVSAILGFIFIWMLKRGAAQERIEKYVKQIRDSNETQEQREDRKYKEDQTHCVRCDKWIPFWDDIPCKKCRKLERDKEIAENDSEKNLNQELEETQIRLAEDEKKLAELEKKIEKGKNESQIDESR